MTCNVELPGLGQENCIQPDVTWARQAHYVCPLSYEGGQHGVGKHFGSNLDCLILETLRRRVARGSIMARSGQPADSKRPCRLLLVKHAKC